jgi:hypothetical protein
LCLRCRPLSPTGIGAGLTNRWSARVRDKVPRSYDIARGAQLNRYDAGSALP